MCIALAHERPELVRALALIAPAGARIGQEKLAEVFQAMKVTNSAQARALTRRLFHRAPVLSFLFAPQLRKLYDTPAVRAIVADIDERSFLAPELLSGLRVPTLLLWGGSEKLLPHEAIEYFRTHLTPQCTKSDRQGVRPRPTDGAAQGSGAVLGSVCRSSPDLKVSRCAGGDEEPSPTSRRAPASSSP
jgi:pimeloyl-ACP methyl ester carboxylesterase